MQMRDQRGQFFFRMQRRDPVQFTLDWRQTLLVDGVGVHAAAVVVADFLLVGSRSAMFRRCLLHDVMQRFCIELEEVHKLIELRHVRRNRMQLGEVPAGVLVEIRAGIRCSVHCSGIVAGDGLELRCIG